MVAHQRLAVEGAPKGMFSALAPMDLLKAYELIPHHCIIDGAIRDEFRSAALQVICSVLRLPRRICAQGCYSEFDIVVSFSSIIAGSVFGPCLLRMSPQCVLDQWHARGQ